MNSIVHKPVKYLQFIRYFCLLFSIITFYIGFIPGQPNRVVGIGLTGFFVFFILRAIVEFMTGKVEGAISIISTRLIFKEIFYLNILMGAIIGILGTLFGLTMIIPF